MKALLAPLISFDVKTPIQAFTDTLPPKLKDAILNHHVMVGMSTEMVMYREGAAAEASPAKWKARCRSRSGSTAQPPKEVEFVRINGNRVIRVEIAKVGEQP